MCTSIHPFNLWGASPVFKQDSWPVVVVLTCVGWSGPGYCFQIGRSRSSGGLKHLRMPCYWQQAGGVLDREGRATGQESAWCIWGQGGVESMLFSRIKMEPGDRESIREMNGKNPAWSLGSACFVFKLDFCSFQTYVKVEVIIVMSNRLFRLCYSKYSSVRRLSFQVTNTLSFVNSIFSFLSPFSTEII